MIVIFDLDGTLALIDHRLPLIQCSPKRWPEFFAACVHDEPNEPVIRTARAFYASGYRVVIVTGRSDAVRGETMNWLNRFGVPFHELHMRPQGDFSPDDELKRAWLDELLQRHALSDILCAFEDRARVVRMWRAAGVACFQVATGDF